MTSHNNRASEDRCVFELCWVSSVCVCGQMSPCDIVRSRGQHVVNDCCHVQQFLFFLTGMWLGPRHRKAQDSYACHAASEASLNTCGSCEKRKVLMFVGRVFFVLREGCFLNLLVGLCLAAISGGALKYGGLEAVDPIVRHPATLVRSPRKCFLVNVVSKHNTCSC